MEMFTGLVSSLQSTPDNTTALQNSSIFVLQIVWLILDKRSMCSWIVLPWLVYHDVYMKGITSVHTWFFTKKLTGEGKKHRLITYLHYKHLCTTGRHECIFSVSAVIWKCAGAVRDRTLPFCCWCLLSPTHSKWNHSICTQYNNTHIYLHHILCMHTLALSTFVFTWLIFPKQIHLCHYHLITRHSRMGIKQPSFPNKHSIHHRDNIISVSTWNSKQTWMQRSYVIKLILWTQMQPTRIRSAAASVIKAAA